MGCRALGLSMLLPLVLGAGCVRASIRTHDDGSVSDGGIQPDGGPRDTGPPGWAVSIGPDAGGGHVALFPDTTHDVYPQSLTYDVWIDLESLHGRTMMEPEYVFHATDGTSREIFLRTGRTSSVSLECGVGDTSGAHVAAALIGAYGPGRGWTHVACTFDFTARELRIWIAGVMQGSASMALFVPPMPMTTLAIGGSAVGRPSILGRVDELRISPSVRYTGMFSPERRYDDTDPDTIALWHFDEGTGTPAEARFGMAGGNLVEGAAWVRE